MTRLDAMQRAREWSARRGFEQAEQERLRQLRATASLNVTQPLSGFREASYVTTVGDLPEATDDDVGRIIQVRNDAAVDTLNIGVSQADGTVVWVPLNVQLDTGSIAYVYSAQFGTSGTGSGQFTFTADVVTDSSNNRFVTDFNNHRVQAFDSTGTYKSRLPSSGTSSGSGNSQFSNPAGIAVDSTGKVYVADTGNNRIQVLSYSAPTLSASSRWGSLGSGNGQFSTPFGIAIDVSDNVWVADTFNHRVQKLSTAGTWAATVGSYGTGNGEFNQPRAVATDATQLYVADTGNNRVQVFNLGTGAYVTQWGSNGNANGQFRNPRGIDVTSDGYVFVTDYDNQRVQVFDTAGTFLARFGEYGTGSGQVRFPAGVHVSAASGRVWVADSVNNRIQGFVRQGRVTQVSGSATTIGSGNSGTATADCPNGMVATGGGHEWSLTSSSNLVVTVSTPNATTTGWTVTGNNASNTSRTLKAYVVCLSG